MVFRFVWTVALDAFSSLNATQKGGVSPLPAILALENSRIHIHTSNCGDVIAHIEAPVNEKFSIFSTLNIPDVDPNNGHIRLRRDFNNSRFRHEGDVVENMILLEDGFDVKRGKFLHGVRMREERYADNFQV